MTHQEQDSRRFAREAKARREAERNGRHPPTDPYTENQRGDAWEGEHPSDDPGSGTPAHDVGDQLGILLSDVQPQRVEWLWPRRIPSGKLTILDGDPGLGKSVLTLDLAARVSRGWPMPEGEPGEDRVPAGVVILTAEDGLDDTVVPRLIAAGADLTRILALDMVWDSEGKSKQLPCLPDDAPCIATAARKIGAALIIVDPMTAYLGERINSHRDADCRRALWPLAKIAEDTGAGVIVVRHLNKAGSSNPLYRGGGSIGLIGAARSGLLLARDPDNPDRRVLAATKCNLTKMPSSLGLALSAAENGALRIGWIGPSPHTAETLLAVAEDDEERGAVVEASDVLRSVLIGRRLAADVKREARQAGVSEISLRRAKALLGVRSERQGFGPEGEWYWFLPPSSP